MASPGAASAGVIIAMVGSPIDALSVIGAAGAALDVPPAPPPPQAARPNPRTRQTAIDPGRGSHFGERFQASLWAIDCDLTFIFVILGFQVMTARPKFLAQY
jgi:hypothetical protein